MITSLNAYKRHFSTAAAIGFTALALAACNTSFSSEPDGGIDFRKNRHAEVTSMREYRECRDEALALDAKARQAGSPARYLASARMIEGCEAALGTESARLSKFKIAFAGSDLYYADGSSFSDTMTLVLGEADDAALGEFSVVNVSPELKAELRRVRYWQRN